MNSHSLNPVEPPFLLLKPGTPSKAPRDGRPLVGTLAIGGGKAAKAAPAGGPGGGGAPEARHEMTRREWGNGMIIHSYHNSCQLFHPWEFQGPKLEVPTI